MVTTLPSFPLLDSVATFLSDAAVLLTVDRELFIDNLLVGIHFIIVRIRWTGLALWEFEFTFPGSLTSTFLCSRYLSRPSTFE